MFNDLDEQGFVVGGKVELAKLILELYKVANLSWLPRCLVLQLAMWVEVAWKDKEHSETLSPMMQHLEV